MLKSKDPGLLTLVKNGDGLQGPGTDFNPPHFLRTCLGGLEERQVTNAFHLGEIYRPPATLSHDPVPGLVLGKTGG